ncbi:MAG: hypothetical protein HY461_00630 [Parcubacteria group bacterium]|nr:hypothetical protein [Parcubacteria group bacterium]
MRPQPIHFLVGACVLALLVAAGLYADKVYEAPQPPPEIIQTIKGPVVLYKQAQAGELITAPDLGTIYYLNQDLKRVVFPDEQTFLSWYPDFSLVKHIPQELLESFPLSGRNATIRPGTWLVKIESSPQVWVIAFPNTLLWLADGEPQVQAMFGSDWSKRVVDVPEYFFGNYTQGPAIKGTAGYPAGFLVHFGASNEFYLITPDGQRLVSEAGMQANHLQARFAVEVEQPLDIVAGPVLDSAEPRWNSPDSLEQAADRR